MFSVALAEEAALSFWQGMNEAVLDKKVNNKVRLRKSRIKAFYSSSHHQSANVLLFFQTQKQPPEMFYEKRCFYKSHKIYRKTHVPASLSK